MDPQVAIATASLGAPVAEYGPHRKQWISSLVSGGVLVLLGIGMIGMGATGLGRGRSSGSLILVAFGLGFLVLTWFLLRKQWAAQGRRVQIFAEGMAIIH